MDKEDKENKESIKKRIVTFRSFQAIFFGIFALGISLLLGDGSSALKLPFGSFAITTTIFGLVGSIISGRLAESSKEW